MISILRFLSSRKVAIVLLAVAIFLSLGTASIQSLTVWPLAITLAALVLSLMACVFISGLTMWRGSKGLFVFHIGLIGVALAGLASALWNFNGTFVLTESQRINDEFLPLQRAPLYKHHLGGFEFELLTADVAFNAHDDGILSGDHHIVVTRPGSTASEETIRYNHPVLFGAYRFYLAKNQGIAVVYRYRAKAPGSAERPDVVYLPTYPEARDAQIAAFALREAPGKPISVRVTDASQLPFDQKRRWRLAPPQDLSITLSFTGDHGGRQRADLSPGATVDVGGGILTYEGPRVWQAFIVDYDPARGWMAFFAALTFAGITWHYVRGEFTRGRRRKESGQA